MKEKIRILHFAKLVSRNDFVDSVVSNLDPAIFEVYVATFQDTSLTFSPVFKEKGITHINIGETNARNFAKLVPALNRVIRKHKIQIFHAHLFEESLIGGFLKLLNPRVKFIIGRHYSDEIYLLHRGGKRKVWLSIEGFANRMADNIVAGSEMVRDILEQQKVKSKKIARIPYGFDFKDCRYHKNSTEESCRIREQHGIKDDELMLVNVGRLFNLKGQSLLIDVFADLIKKYKNLKLLIIGDGPDRAMLEQKVARLSLNENVLFTGWLKDAHTYVSAADIVVHPTLSEMFSQLMVETMALGKPLVINNVSGVPDVVEDKVNGIICKHEHGMWYEALESLICNPEYRQQLGAAAEKHVKTKYPIQDVIKLYETLYLELNKQL